MTDAPRKLVFVLRTRPGETKYYYDTATYLPPGVVIALLADKKNHEALKALDPETYTSAMALAHLLHTYPLRMRFNPDMRGPYVATLEDELDEDDLLNYINALPVEKREAFLRDASIKGFTQP